jgi:hypothetical protein
MAMRSFAQRSAAFGRNKDVVFDAKPVIKALNQIEPGLKREMLKDMKAITKPAISEIKSVIPSTAPFSGISEERTFTQMPDRKLNNNGDGRLSWTGGLYKNRVIAPDNVIPKFSASRSRKYAVTSLFGIWLRSPGVALVATAGKGSGRPGYSRTREYAYKGGTRSHRNNGQGAALIRRVKKVGLFNFFYKAGESQLPSIEREVKLTYESYSKRVNRRLN